MNRPYRERERERERERDETEILDGGVNGVATVEEERDEA